MLFRGTGGLRKAGLGKWDGPSFWKGQSYRTLQLRRNGEPLKTPEQEHDLLEVSLE